MIVNYGKSGEVPRQSRCSRRGQADARVVQGLGRG